MSNIRKALTPEFPDDVRLLRKAIPFLEMFSAIEVAVIWEAFSREACAGWLTVNPEWLEHFKKWMDQ